MWRSRVICNYNKKRQDESPHGVHTLVAAVTTDDRWLLRLMDEFRPGGGGDGGGCACLNRSVHKTKKAVMEKKKKKKKRHIYKQQLQGNRLTT